MMYRLLFCNASVHKIRAPGKGPYVHRLLSYQSSLPSDISELYLYIPTSPETGIGKALFQYDSDL